MSTFVLVHGGRHGGWCWRRVADRLVAHGHRVFTPTATGMGERSHLLSPDITLAVHIADIVNVLEWEDLCDVILVGHSYGGVLITGAAAASTARIAHLVYLDAMMPIDGESVLDMSTPPKAAMLRSTIDGPGQGWCLPANRSARDYGVESAADVAWVDAKMSAQPARTYLDRIADTRPAWKLPGTFIECTRNVQQPTPISMIRATQRAQRDPTFEYRRLDAAHDAMVTAPDELTAMLIKIASSVATCVQSEAT